MKKDNAFFVRYLSLLLVLYLGACDQKKPQGTSDLVLFDFGTDFDTQFVVPQDAQFKWISDKDNGYLEVVSGFTIKEPGVKLKASPKNPWNLKGYYQIKADVTNVGDTFMQVEMFVGNDPDGLKRWYCSDYVDLDPGETKTITVPLAWTSYVFSPPIEVGGMRGVPGMLKTDVSKIDEITLNARYSYDYNRFTVDNVRAVGKLQVRDSKDFFPFVDEFGQYAHDDWEGKIHSIAELRKVDQENRGLLEKNPGPADRSVYGGWAKGPRLEATGFFRTEKYQGKWWMVDPEGYLFFSSGVNCMASESTFTGITDREHYFSAVPNKEKNSQFYTKGGDASHGFYKEKAEYDAFNFYQHNLYKKYGDEWLSEFRSLAHQRLKSWGLNTIGFVSDFGATEQHKTPYVGSIWINGTPKIEGSDGFWGKFHDVFDPNFRQIVRASVAAQKEGAGDPWCIGYFIDNELSWGALGSLSLGTLKSPALQPAKIEFIKDLKAKYGTTNALNDVWGTDHPSWEALAKTTKTPEPTKAEADLLAFYEKIATTYFKIVNEELKRVAPQQNYLGCRFAWKNNASVLKAASKYLDVMSFNKYEYSVAQVSLPEGLDKPILIGEFHFGATDHGSYHPGVKVAKDQEDRGRLYKEYVQGALRNPLIVGAHWFQYLDEPFTGRFDGENYNVGLIDAYDNPYEELVSKMRETLYPMYEYRLAQ